MNLGWLCLDGTNTWSTVSTLGTGINVRLPIIKRLVASNDTISWFGIRKDSHLVEGEKNNRVLPYYEAAQVSGRLLRAAQKEWNENYARESWQRRNNPNKFPMSKWVGGRAVEDTLSYWKENKTLPVIDVLVAEYMDTGMGQIAFFSSILAHYAAQNVPIYVWDQERRFRYVSELKRLYADPRPNMYEHRLERYIPHRIIDLLRGKIKMCYPFDAEWDDGTNGYYRLPSFNLSAIYDPARALSLPTRQEKIVPVVMVGNDNRRRPFIEKWYGGLKHKAQIHGNWEKRDAAYVNSWKEINRRVKFYPPMPQHLLLQTQRTGWATIHHLPQMSIDLGQVTYRVCEAPLAGTIMICPKDITTHERFTLSDFVASSPDHINQLVWDLMDMPMPLYHFALIEQRELVEKNFGADKVISDFLEMLIDDGVDVWN